MSVQYLEYWEKIRSATPIQRALALSVALHTMAGVALVTMPDRVDMPPVPITHEIQYVELSNVEPVKEEEKAKPEPPKPKPEPPKPKPKPKPKPEPKKTIEVAKKPVEKPKPEPKPKIEPKPKPPKPKPIEVAKRIETPTPPKPEVIPEAPTETGIKIKEALPSALNAWGRMVQRKVERNWIIPGGIRLDKEHTEAVISFWVDREGRLLGKPKIVTKGENQALVESGLNAIIWAEPLPPLPDGYKGSKQEVVYAFNLVKPSLMP